MAASSKHKLDSHKTDKQSARPAAPAPPWLEWLLEWLELWLLERVDVERLPPLEIGRDAWLLVPLE